MGRVLRAGSAVAVAMVASLLGGCGSDDRHAVDLTSSSTAAPSAASVSDGSSPAPRLERPPLQRCLHASTVPVEGEPSPLEPGPEPETDLEPRFWLPFYVECDPGVPLLGGPPELDRQPGTQPRS